MIDPPIHRCAMRLRAVAQTNRRAIAGGSAMYAAALCTLTGAISFSPEERLLKAKAALKALEATRDKQVGAAARAAHSEAGMNRAIARVNALYEKEMATCQEELSAAEAALRDAKPDEHGD